MSMNAAVFFTRRVGHVADELFSASTNELLHLFDYTEDISGCCCTPAGCAGHRGPSNLASEPVLPGQTRSAEKVPSEA